MSSGPTKEELQNYWTNNRQYFDTLAKYYQETDKEYYRIYIAPFYGSFNRSTGKPKTIVFLAVFILFLGMGLASFLVMRRGSIEEISPPKIDQKDTTLKGRLIDTTRSTSPRDSSLRRFLSPEYDNNLPKRISR